MAGQGKYTIYVSPNKAKQSFLNRLFATHPYAKAGGAAAEQADVVAYVNGLGNTHLLPATQQGNPKHFNNGVDLTYTYSTGADEDRPNLTKVTWATAGKKGGPATPYFPDLRSPGILDGVDIHLVNTNPITNFEPSEKAPEINTTDIKPRHSIENPTDTGPKIHVLNPLGQNLTLGKSGIAKNV